MLHFRILSLATLALVSPAPIMAQTPPLTDPQFQAISEEIFRPIIEAYDIPGIAVGLTLNGEHYLFTDGMADRKAAVPVDRDTLFELGSNSKLFNAALAALAEQRGLLSLHDPVAKHLPDLSGDAFALISLYDLAAHATGSLPLQVPDDLPDRPALMAWLAQWEPGVDPASFRSYSNVSIGLLGLITGDRFGMSYEEAATSVLFPALGLRSTYVTVPDTAMQHYAFGYSRDENKPIRVNPGMLDAEAYGVKSSVTDMVYFLDAHLGHAALDAEVSAALARTRIAEYDTVHYAQAMIWEAYAWPVTAAQLEAGNSPEMALTPQPLTRNAARLPDDAVFLNKTGSTNGFGSYVAMVPSEEIGVVILANRNYPNPVRAEAALKLITEVLALDER